MGQVDRLLGCSLLGKKSRNEEAMPRPQAPMER